MAQTTNCGDRNVGSAKHPIATPRLFVSSGSGSSGTTLMSQKSVVPHSGQKWQSTVSPRSDTRVKTLDFPETLTVCSGKYAATPKDTSCPFLTLLAVANNNHCGLAWHRYFQSRTDTFRGT